MRSSEHGPRWLLIDLDASVRVGGALGRKRSTGYCAPELIQLDGALLPDAAPSFDVWSFGVVLFLLCTGLTLFHVDALDDNLEDDTEVARLAAWRGVSEASLAKVFAAAGRALEEEELEAARDLLTWWYARDTTPRHTPSLPPRLPR